MIRNESFWTGEDAGAPIMGKDRGYLAANQEAMLELAASWPGLMGVEPQAAREGVEHSRIVTADAERTFFTDEARSVLMRVLTEVETTYEDYGQAASYAAGFLLLTLPEDMVTPMMVKLNGDPKYIAGFWGREAVPSVVDACVFGCMLNQFYPDVAAHLVKLAIHPKTFCQKWFVGLGVHVLHFEALFKFWTHFLTEGYTFLFKFALAHIGETREMIKATDKVEEVYRILRLDDIATEDDLRLRIVEAAIALPVDASFGPFITAARVEMFEKEVKPGIERAAAAKAAAEEMSDDGMGDECALCKDNFPDVWCSECKEMICEFCLEETDHDSSHTTTPLEEWEAAGKPGLEGGNSVGDAGAADNNTDGAAEAEASADATASGPTADAVADAADALAAVSLEDGAEATA